MLSLFFSGLANFCGLMGTYKEAKSKREEKRIEYNSQAAIFAQMENCKATSRLRLWSFGTLGSYNPSNFESWIFDLDSPWKKRVMENEKAIKVSFGKFRTVNLCFILMEYFVVSVWDHSVINEIFGIWLNACFWKFYE